MMLTIIVPQAHIAKANHLAMCKGYSEADGLSYGVAGWQDAGGNLYATTSLMADMFAAPPTALCERPAWDTGSAVYLDQAAQAQAMLVIHTPEGNAPLPSLGPDKIIVIRGPHPLDALRMIGLTQVPEVMP